MIQRRLSLCSAFVASLAIAASSAIGATGPTADPAALKPEPQFAYAEQIVTRLLSTSHYARRPIDDQLSRKVLDGYLDGLDGGRSYLLAADVAELTAKHGTTLDDALVRNDVRPAYAIYALYAQRVEERIAYALKLLDQPVDFTVAETFQFDREGAPWPADQAALDGLWRKRVKNDLIGLMLTGKSEAESRDLLRKRYANFLHRAHQVKSGDVFESFMNAYTQVYDPHTSYLGPRDSEEFAIAMKLKYEGIGAALQVQDEYVLVARILPGGAAARTGVLREQDRIIAVGQAPDFQMVDVVGWRLDDVVRLIRGPKDTEVRLQVLPAGDAPGAADKLVTLTRGEIKLEDRAAKKEILEVPRPDGTFKVGVIRVPTFYQDFEGRRSGASDYTSTTRDVRRLLGELKAAKVDGVLIDLRDNGGGSLQEAAELTGLFIDAGPVVQLRSSSGKVDVMDDPESGIAYSGPLTVVVNRFSASASEIFAGAIQDYGRGLVVGTNTYGKGTIQSLIDLNQYVRPGANLCGSTTCPPTDLGQLKITMGKFYRVTGSSTQHRGVVPDLVLPSAIDPEEFGESAQDSALPWDSIDQTRFDARRIAGGLLPSLSREHERRIGLDAEFKLFVEDVADARVANARGTVSLVLTERKAERDRLEAQRLARENQRRAKRGEAPVAKLSDIPPRADGEGPDPLLEEAAEILVDAVNMTGGTGDLAHLAPRPSAKKPPRG